MSTWPDQNSPTYAGVTRAADDRRLPLRGAHNVRDLGGYNTVGGRRLKRGMLYRADGLHRLTRHDIRRMQKLDLRTAVDFREEREYRRKPDRLPNGVRQLWVPIDVGGAELRQEVRAAISGTGSGDLSDVMVRVGRELVNGHTPAYRSWLHDMVTEDDALPQIFHCTAGKDRTGLASALLLRILGVPPETVFDDYELSNLYLTKLTKRVIRHIRLISLFRGDANTVRPILVADRRYLEASFEAIDAGWGGFDRYVEHGLGLDGAAIEALETRLLEDGRPQTEAATTTRPAAPK